MVKTDEALSCSTTVKPVQKQSTITKIKEQRPPASPAMQSSQPVPSQKTQPEDAMTKLIATDLQELHVAVGSGNQVKVNAVIAAFKQVFPSRNLVVRSANAPSNVQTSHLATKKQNKEPSIVLMGQLVCMKHNMGFNLIFQLDLRVA